MSSAELGADTVIKQIELVDGQVARIRAIVEAAAICPPR